MLVGNAPFGQAAQISRARKNRERPFRRNPLLASFLIIGVVTEKYFIPALENIAGWLKLSESIAGATLLAFGSSAPELFTALLTMVTTRSAPSFGVGSIIGSAFSQILVVIGFAATVKTTYLRWRSVVRDGAVYAAAVITDPLYLPIAFIPCNCILAADHRFASASREETNMTRRKGSMLRGRPGFPLPTRIRCEGETAAAGQRNGEMLRVEKRLLELADRFGKPLGLDRRRFLQSSCGMAAAFIAMNSVFGPFFAVAPAEAADPEAAAERMRSLAEQLIIDVQTHFVYPEYPSRGILGLRELAKRWNPQLQGEQTVEKIQFDNFFEEVFLNSDTALAVLSSAPADDPKRYFLHNDELMRARERVEERAGSRRLLAHALFTPGCPGWLDDLDRAIAMKPDAWKGYTVGMPFGQSRWPWRLDDENLVYPAYEKMVKAGITTVCIHKGLLPSNYRQRMANTWKYGAVDDVPKAARDWPQLRFLIYHSGIRTGGIPTGEQLQTFENSGEIPWVTDLARIPQEHGVDNVYAELGSVFAVTAVSAPRYCAGILGTLIKGMGEDRVLWGTDSVWYGSPQWQIEAMRRLEMPEDQQKRFGFQPLGPADGPLKKRIFAGNAHQVYSFDTGGLKTDRMAGMKRGRAEAETGNRREIKQ